MAALDALPEGRRAGYETPGTEAISFERMCRVAPWDYPILFWLQKQLRPGMNLLDAGGHMGTKYIAFRDLVALDQVTWTVTDLPAIVSAARTAQGRGSLPASIRFADSPAQVAAPDLLLASGLLQYLDQPFGGFVDALPKRPPLILLNKVALWDAREVVTLERIGPARVPYRIRNRAAFLAEVDSLGYALRDSWTIPELGRRIPTHPGLGMMESCGFMLELRTDSV
ncbi:methyltransferase, TIGR04325 family [Aliiruegeria haliotis]|nr:methyltransferase, TIGR04325 family [Aliiruegeria haliotis]